MCLEDRALSTGRGLPLRSEDFQILNSLEGPT